jgi:hypothetical protein
MCPRCGRTYANRNQVLRLFEPADIDAEFRRWLADAYSVGEQRHHARQPPHR